MKSSHSFPQKIRSTSDQPIIVPIQQVKPLHSNDFDKFYVGSIEGYESPDILFFSKKFIPLREAIDFSSKNMSPKKNNKKSPHSVIDLALEEQTNSSLKREHDDETPFGFMKKRHESTGDYKAYDYDSDTGCPVWEHPDVWEEFCNEIDKENTLNTSNQKK